MLSKTVQFYWSKQGKRIGQFSLSGLWANSSCTVNPIGCQYSGAESKSELSPMGDSSLCTRHYCS